MQFFGLINRLASNDLGFSPPRNREAPVSCPFCWFPPQSPAPPELSGTGASTVPPARSCLPNSEEKSCRLYRRLQTNRTGKCKKLPSAAPPIIFFSWGAKGKKKKKSVVLSPSANRFPRKSSRNRAPPPPAFSQIIVKRHYKEPSRRAPCWGGPGPPWPCIKNWFPPAGGGDKQFWI